MTAECPGCGEEGLFQRSGAGNYSIECTNDDCDVWYYGQENREGGGN